MRSKFKWIYTLLLALSMQFSFAQEKTVTGVVSDETGPLPGVNVVVQGTDRGVQTDIDGRYSISAKAGDVLVFSFVGMTDVTMPVGASNVINATLQQGIELETVVVTAMNIRRKADAITSSYDVVDNETLTQAANPNAVQALVGKVSGIQINATNAGLGGSNSIVFRGNRTMTGSNGALIVIDGAISTVQTFEQIPPELIESVTTLKGAQGAALYGSDGVNGAIVITTRRGAKGEKFTVSLTSSLDILDIAYLPERQQRYGQGWDGVHSSFENGSWGPEYDGSLQPVGLPQADGTYIMRPYSPINDNIKQFFKKGTLSQNNITLSGGSLETGYVVFSANRQQTDFIVEGDELKRNAFLLKAGKKMGKWSVEGNFNYISQIIKSSESGLYDDLLQTPGNIPVGDFSHGQNQHHWTIYYLNPWWLSRNQREDNRQDKFTAIVNLGYEFNKNISVSYLANLRLDMSNNQSYRNAYVDEIAAIYGTTNNSITSEYFTDQTFNRRFYGDLLFNFDYDLSDDFSFDANIGNNIQDQWAHVNQVGGLNLEIPGIYNYTNVLSPWSAGQLNGDVGNYYQKRREVSVFANVDFGFRDYLFLNLTARNEWSSVFSKENQSYFYPSAGLSFVATDAIPGLKGDVVNFMKILANWTRVGNDNNVGPYAINQLGSLGIGYPFSGANSYVQQITQTDPNIRPEFVTSTELAINTGFFGDRLTLDLAGYITETTDLITVSSVSNASGIFRQRGNAGSMETKGFDIDLGVRPIWSKASDGFRWEANLNFTKFESTVTEVADGAAEVNLRQPYAFVGIFAVVGDDFPMIKGTKYARDDQGRIIVDENGNPTIDPTMQNLGKVNPDFIVGLNSSVAYKGIKLAATMDFRTGGHFYSDVKRNLAWTGQLIESAENRSGFIMPNSSFLAADGTYQPNTSIVTGGGSTTNFINYYNTYYQSAGENLVLDATAFKLREVALSYTLPAKYLDRTGLSNVTFGVQGRNLFTWLPEQNRFYNDPETGETTGTSGQGLAFTDRYPVQKSYGFSVNLTF
ncbi:MAG TPA: SusC/RagA family TonB-linked outer membrane protein [Flavobacterium sp.]